MAGGANDKGDHNPSSTTTCSSNDPVGRGSDLVHCSGTLESFNKQGIGSPNYSDAEINSGKNSGASNQNHHHQASNSGGESTRLPNLCSGTQSSFNCHGGSQKFAGARINSGENSGNRGGPSVVGYSSGTFRSVSQDFTGAKVNSGENSGKRGGPSSGPAGASEHQLRVKGTRDSFNNYGSTQRSNRLNCFGTRLLFENYQSKSQDFSGARINSGENSGDI